MSDVTPLLLWTEHKPEGDDLQALKDAKIASGVQLQVVPRRAFPGCGRFLAVGVHPEWVADYAYVKGLVIDTPSELADLAEKIKWVLTGDGMPDYGMDDKLSEFMGIKVTESFDDIRGTDPLLDDERPYREMLKRERVVEFS